MWREFLLYIPFVLFASWCLSSVFFPPALVEKFWFCLSLFSWNRDAPFSFSSFSRFLKSLQLFVVDIDDVNKSNEVIGERLDFCSHL